MARHDNIQLRVATIGYEVKINKIIWLNEIIEKLETKHNVRQEEATGLLTINRTSDLLKKGTAPAKMFMLLWGKQTPVVI